MAITFPTSLDTFTTRNSGDTISEDHMNDVQDAIEALEAKVGINSSAVDTSLDYKVNNFFVENTRKIWFYENTAPTGWTYASAITDQVISVKGGSEAYSVNGGTEEAGSWTISSIAAANESTHTHTGPSHTHTMGTHSHTTPDHTLTKAEIPTHLHTIQRDKNRSSTQGGTIMWSDQVGSGYDNTTDGSGDGLGGGAHNHGNTETVDPGDTNSGGTGATGAGAAHTHTVTHTAGWRPDAAVGIIATFTGA